MLRLSGSACAALVAFFALMATAQGQATLTKVPDYVLKEWNDLKGPAAASVFRFAKQRIVECDMQNGANRCALSAIAAKVFLYHSDDGDKPATALAFIMYTPTSGNMVLSDVRIFARQSDGVYKPSRELTELVGGPDTVKAEKEGFTVVMQTMKPDDAHCCPTGRTTWRVDARSAMATFISGYRPR